MIRDYVGKITHSNNTASETYASQYVMTDILDGLEMGSVLDASGSELCSIFVQADGTCLHQISYRFVRKGISAIERKYWIMNFEQFDDIAVGASRRKNA